MQLKLQLEYSIHFFAVDIIGLVTFCIETAFYSGLL